MTRWGPEEQTVLERHRGNVKTNVFLLFQEDTFILSFNTCFFLFFYTTGMFCSCSMKGSHLIMNQFQHSIIITGTFSSVSF